MLKLFYFISLTIKGFTIRDFSNKGFMLRKLGFVIDYNLNLFILRREVMNQLKKPFTVLGSVK